MGFRMDLYIDTNAMEHPLLSRGDHYSDVIMGAMASQIITLTIVYSIV